MPELHPVLAARDTRMRAEASRSGIAVGHVRTVATYEQQKALYDRYRAGTGNLAVDPDAPGYLSPWGWRQRGSWHMVQVDGYGHAIDYSWDGCTAVEFHTLCARHGIGFPVAGEDWHAQWFDWNGIYIDHSEPKDDDMNAQQFADAIGATIPTDGPLAGKVCVPLIDDNLQTTTLYPLASAITFTHQEMKMKRIRG